MKNIAPQSAIQHLQLDVLKHQSYRRGKLSLNAEGSRVIGSTDLSVGRRGSNGHVHRFQLSKRAQVACKNISTYKYLQLISSALLLRIRHTTKSRSIFDFKRTKTLTRGDKTRMFRHELYDLATIANLNIIQSLSGDRTIHNRRRISDPRGIPEYSFHNIMSIMSFISIESMPNTGSTTLS